MKTKVLILLLVTASLCLSHAQSDEREVEVEGSAVFQSTMPGDDEDLETEESGSGEVTMEPSTTLAMTESVKVYDDVQEEPEMMTTFTPSSKDEEPVADAVIPDEEPDTSSKNNKFPEPDEEEEEPDVNTDLEKEDVNVDDDVNVEETSSFHANSQFLAALIVGGCVGILFAVCVILLLAYRMRKKDEGSYSLGDQKKLASPNSYDYTPGQEYYA